MLTPCKDLGKQTGSSNLIWKNYPNDMKNFKNLLIATLTGLLALSLFTQPAQSSGPQVMYSKTAKAIQYDHCLRLATKSVSIPEIYLDTAIGRCVNYRP